MRSGGYRSDIGGSEYRGVNVAEILAGPERNKARVKLKSRENITVRRNESPQQDVKQR